MIRCTTRSEAAVDGFEVLAHKQTVAGNCGWHKIAPSSSKQVDELASKKICLEDRDVVLHSRERLFANLGLGTAVRGAGWHRAWGHRAHDEVFWPLHAPLDMPWKRASQTEELGTVGAGAGAGISMLALHMLIQALSLQKCCPALHAGMLHVGLSHCQG
jgi:hypothetical protein